MEEILFSLDGVDMPCFQATEISNLFLTLGLFGAPWAQMAYYGRRLLHSISDPRGEE